MTNAATLAQQGNELRDHLSSEIVIHRSLLQLAEQQQRLLVAHDLNAFAQLTSTMEQRVTEQQRLRKMRDALFVNMRQLLPPSNAAPTLSSIIAAIGEPLRGELQARSTVLKDTVAQLRSTHERNQALLRQALGFTRDMMQALTGDQQEQGYDRSGLGRGRPGRGNLVNIAG
jgi:flagellar biosynthesis/type III secretory pathway chaperone